MRLIGHFIDYIGYARGGAETNVEGLCRHNESEKYKFEIVTSATPFRQPVFHDLRVPVRLALGFYQVREAAFRVKGKQSDLLYRLPGAIYKLSVRRYFNNYDLIHCHGYDTMEAFRDGGRRTPIVLTVYNPPPRRHLVNVAYANRIIIRSRELFSEMLKNFDEKKLVYIPPGCEFSYYQNYSGENVPPHELTSNESHTQLLFVGRFRPFKNIEALLHSLKILNSSQPKTVYDLTIVGDGPLRRRLQSLTESLGIMQNVHFAGTVPSQQMGAFYNNADLVVVPSFYESFSQVSLESLVARKRLLISSGMTEFRSKFSTVPVCDPYSPGDIAEKISATLLRAPIVIPVEELQTYSWERIVAQHYNLYDEVLAS